MSDTERIEVLEKKVAALEQATQPEILGSFVFKTIKRFIAGLFNLPKKCDWDKG